MAYQKAPRLFTGALFSEELSRGLQSFSQRHHLKSHIWIPKKLVGQVKKGSALLPNAILCDVALFPGCGYSCIRKTIGFDHILVNAEHTTDQDYFEMYSKEITRGNSAFLPLTVTGAPIRNSRTTELITRSKDSSYKNPYWIALKGENRRWMNAEETHRQGAYNPTDCVFYDPHTLTHQTFSFDIALLMRRKASRFGYVSRLWLTAAEGERHRARLHPERMFDGAPLFVGTFSGGGRSVEYFCADQFADPAVFPTAREIVLAATGVFVGAEKVRGYPLLASVAAESDPATRHRCMEEQRQKFSALKLWGIPKEMENMLLQSDAVEVLRRFAFLRGFTRPHFVSSNSLALRLLPLKPEEQGVLIQLDTKGGKISSAIRFCWFNTEQFVEPSLAEEIQMRPPTNYATDSPLLGRIAATCARMQLERKECSMLWISESSLKENGGEVIPGAIGVPSSNDNSTMFYNLCDTSLGGPGSKGENSSSFLKESRAECNEADTPSVVSTHIVDTMRTFSQKQKKNKLTHS